MQRHHLGLAVLPGVTGRRDVFAERRGEVLAELRSALEACAAPGSTVTVVAPAPLSRTTTTAQPDLGASGYAPAHGCACPHTPSVPPSCESDTESDTECATSADAPDHAAEPGLHGAASAAVLLLRMAGWPAQITTHEVGAGERVTSTTLVAPGAVSGEAGTHLVLFACATEDGVLPVGAAAALAEAEAATHALYREVTIG